MGTSRILSEVDAALSRVRKQLDYQKYLTPKNYNQENEVFLDHYRRGERYNPRYAYNVFDPTDALRAVQSIDVGALDDSPVGHVLRSSYEGILDEIELYSHLGDNKLFPVLSRRVNGVPDERYRSLALDALNEPRKQEESGRAHTPDDLCRTMERRIGQYGFDWDVRVLPNMAARVSVEPDDHAVYINQKASFTASDIKRLQVHEIDTHVLRAENGHRRGLDIFSSGTRGSLIHEEGLALYNEERNGVTDPFSARLYAARFLVCLEIERPFYDLFDMLRQLGCDESLAIYVVPRIKRGLSDTSLPGGFIKDYVYFQGRLEIAEALEHNPALYRQMYFGAISLHDVRSLRQEIEQAEQEGALILPLPIIEG